MFFINDDENTDKIKMNTHMRLFRREIISVIKIIKQIFTFTIIKLRLYLQN
jgi:hypothetical protein